MVGRSQAQSFSVVSALQAARWKCFHSSCALSLCVSLALSCRAFLLLVPPSLSRLLGRVGSLGCSFSRCLSQAVVLWLLTLQCEQESMSLRADQHKTVNHTLCCVVICTCTWTFLSFWIVVFCYVLSVCLQSDSDDLVVVVVVAAKCVCVFSAAATFVLFSLRLFFVFVSLFRLLILLVVCYDSFGIAMIGIRMRWEEKINCACLWFWF